MYIYIYIGIASQAQYLQHARKGYLMHFIPCKADDSEDGAVKWRSHGSDMMEVNLRKVSKIQAELSRHIFNLLELNSQGIGSMRI